MYYVLGVILDDKLSWNWNSHVNNLCNIISRNIGIPRNLNYLPQSALKFVYHSPISSHLSYCSMIWGFSSKKAFETHSLVTKKSCPHNFSFTLFVSICWITLTYEKFTCTRALCHGLLPTSLPRFFPSKC